MKKCFLFLVLALVFSLNLYAQNFATKGDIEVGGSIGFTSTTYVYEGETASESTSSFWVEPYVGYFVVKNFEVGIIPSFSTSSYGDNSSTSFGVYLAPAWNFDLKSSVYPFIEGQIGYNSENTDNGVNDVTRSGLAWALRGGIKVQVGSSALVNLAVKYTQVTLDPDGANDRNGYNQFGIMGGFTIFLNK